MANPPPFPRRVAITAMGVISPLGHGWAETERSLRAGRDCVTPMERFDVSKCRAKTAGQIPEVWEEKAGHRARRQHPASRMLIAAMRETLAGDPEFRPETMVLGTTSGGMSYGEAFYRAQVARRRPAERAAWLANYSPQKQVADVQRAGGFSAPAQIIANACASGSNALGHAFSLIRSGQQRQILCGGYDAICELVFDGFDSLQASTPEKIRPFDKDRTGLVLGEGAATFALEDWESALEREAPIIGEITGYGISTDNHHLTQPHPSGIGPRMAMERALASAGRQAEEIDYINAHGTATLFNDATEGVAISQLFGERVPVSSTKGMMGHSLGAAGAIEAAFTLIALRGGFLPPNINFRTPDPAAPLQIVANESRPATLQRALSNSFGFGGTNASILLELPSAR